MRGISALLFVTLFWLCVSAAPQQAPAPSLPRLIRFSGTILGDDSTPRTGTAGITFSLFQDQTGGAPLWQEVQNVTLRPGGHYSVLLGANSKDGVPMDLFTTNEARWLGVQVEQEAEQPRVLLVSVPYALKAGDAETVAGHPLSDFVMTPAADASSGSSGSTASSTTAGASTVKKSANAPAGTSAPVTTAGGTLNYIGKFDATGTNLVNSAVIDVSGNVGVSKSNPAYTLDVGGVVNAPDVFVQGTSPRLRLIDTTLPNSFWELQQSAYAADNFGFLRYENNIAVPGKSFLVAANGNVGIGTINPGFKLDVAGMVNTSTLLVTSTSPRIRLIDTTLPNSFWELQQSAFFPDNFGFLRYESNSAVATKSFFIAPTGNVGVGVAAPANKLSVAGVVESTTGGFRFPDGSVQSTGAGAGGAARTRGITFLAGCDTCGVLADTDDQKTIYVNVVGAMTFQSVTCYSDTGAPVINIQRNTGSAANILAPDLTCSTTGVTSTSFVAGQNVLNVNDVLDFSMVTAGGAAHRVTVVIRTQLN